MNWNISKNHTWTYLKASKATKKEIFSECLKSKNSLTNFPYTQSTNNQTNMLIEKWCISRVVAPRCPFQGSQLQRHSWERPSKIQFKLLDITEEGFLPDTASKIFLSNQRWQSIRSTLRVMRTVQATIFKRQIWHIFSISIMDRFT